MAQVYRQNHASSSCREQHRDWQSPPHLHPPVAQLRVNKESYQGEGFDRSGPSLLYEAELLMLQGGIVTTVHQGALLDSINK